MTGRVVIRDVVPSAAAGRSAPAIIDRAVPVSAVAFRDGHGIVRARARVRSIGGEWTMVPLRSTIDDGHVGSATFTHIGPHELVIDAWTDRYSSWCRDLRTWIAAGEPVEAEFEMGARLLDDAARVATGAERERVRDAADALRSGRCTDTVRTNAALDDAVGEIVRRLVDPSDLTSSPPVLIRVERERAAIGAWYEFFPRSEGGFAGGAIERLDAIAAMGFDVVYLPPVHPIGITHRKGRHNSLTAGPDDPGSPWGIGSVDGGHCALDSSLGTWADFERFVARAVELDLDVALDVALQCSPDHPWLGEHPEWFAHRPDGSIRYAENPPKKYQDIHPIEFWPDTPHRAQLWDACRDIFEFWIGKGVRIFRVDNPHTKPLAFWEWVIAEIRVGHPDVVLLSEAFTRPALMHELAEVGFSQSYTYFTWRHTADELGTYVDELAYGPHADTFRPNFWPTTPDILIGALRNGTPATFRMRALLASLLSPSWGMIAGYEWCENTPASPDNEEYFDSEKYRIVSRDWSAPPTSDISAWVTTLNRLRREIPSLCDLASHRRWPSADGRVLAWSRGRHGGDAVLVVAATESDVEIETSVEIDGSAFGLGDHFDVTDHLTGETWHWSSGSNYVRFDGIDRIAHVLTLSPTDS